MPRPSPLRRTVPAVLLLALAGCYVEEEPAPQTRVPDEPQPAAQASSPRSDLPAEGRSTLGAAKRSAQNTVSSLEQHDADIEKQLEDE